MSRHHPYGGYDAPARRGGPGPGPGGPDRSFRHERGRGGGGGRGGARGGSVPVAPRGSYGEAPPYANGYGGGGHTQGNGYDDAPHYAPEPHSAGGYYNEYGGGHAPAPAPAPSHESYDYQDSRAYEDGSSRGGPPTRRRPPRERDDHVHESLIEDRINRERPCRTLFIRNIKYETSSEDVRRRFEEFGEIKSFYDLVSSRGMVFVTYFDLRAAERARERLQNTEIAGRPIDVHYSLPRADEQNGRCDRDKNQGTLHLRLRNSPSGMPLDDHEVRRKFQQFGDVKGVRPAGGPMERLVEMYDTRACEDAHDKLRDQALQDGDMEINFAWDIPEQPLPNGPVPQRRFDDAQRGGSEEYGGGGGGGGDSRGRRGGDRGRGARGGSRSDRGGGGGGRGGRGGFRDDRDRGDYGHDDWDRGPPPPSDNYGRGPPPGPMYGVPPQLPPQQHIPPPPVQSYAPPAPQAAAPDDRLEQARKVQQLLAALKNPAAPPAPTPPPAQPVNSYYTPPGAGMPAQVPTPTSYSPYAQSPVAPPAVPYYPPPPAAVAAPVQPAAAVSALPANLLSFLQQHQQQSPATPPPPAVSADPRLAAMQMPVSPTQAIANPQAAALSNILGQLAMFGKRP